MKTEQPAYGSQSVPGSINKVRESNEQAPAVSFEMDRLSGFNPGKIQDSVPNDDESQEAPDTQRGLLQEPDLFGKYDKKDLLSPPEQRVLAKNVSKSAQNSFIFVKDEIELKEINVKLSQRNRKNSDIIDQNPFDGFSDSEDEKIVTKKLKIKNQPSHQEDTQQQPLEKANVQMPKFQTSYRRSYWCSKLFLCFTDVLFQSVKLSENTMKDAMIEDMRETDNEDEVMLALFNKRLESSYEKWCTTHMGPPSSKERVQVWTDLAWSALWSCVRAEYWTCVLLVLISECLALFYCYQIVFIVKVIQAEEFQIAEATQIWVLFSLSVLISAITRNLYSYKGSQMSLKMRKIAISALYDKIGKLSVKSLSQTVSDKLINGYMLNLENQLKNMAFYMAAPILYLLCLGFVYILTDWQHVLIILGLLAVVSLIQLIFFNLQGDYLAYNSMCNAERTKLVKDMVEGNRSVKENAGEKLYIERIKAARTAQSGYIFWEKFMFILNFSILGNMGFLAVLVLLIFEWSRQELVEVGKSFALLAMLCLLFFQIQRSTVTSILNARLAKFTLTKVSAILGMDEVKQNEGADNHDGVSIEIRDANYSWGFTVQQDLARVKFVDSEQPVLSKINLSLESGSLMSISGKIGAGKTSLLYSILGETVRLSGEHSVKGRMALVERKAFIFNETLRDNITCGLEYKESNFNRVIGVTQLDQEIGMFAERWETVLAEAGVGLTDAQIMKICLARAVYSNADIYLIDDILSVFEPFTADKIFKECICEALKEKCVIFVSDTLKHIEKSDSCLVLKDGKPIFDGQIQDKSWPENLQSEYNFVQDCNQSMISRDTQHFLKVDNERLQKIHAELIGNEGQNGRVKPNAKDPLRTSAVQVRRMKRKAGIRQLKAVAKVIEQNLVAQGIGIEHLSLRDDFDSYNRTDTIVYAGHNSQKLIKSAQTHQEERMKVGWKEFSEFLSYSVGTVSLFFFINLCAIQAFSYVLPALYLHTWTGLKIESQQDKNYPMIFGILIALYLVLTLIVDLLLVVMATKGANNMHNMMTEKIIRANFNFFGSSHSFHSIFLRFTKDMVQLDVLLTTLVLVVIPGIFKTVAVVITVGVVNPFMFLIIVFVFAPFTAIILMYGLSVYNKTSTFEYLYKNAIAKNFSTTLNGVVQIRSLGRDTYFRQKFTSNLQKSTNAMFSSMTTMRWITMRLDILLSVFITCVCLLLIIFRDQYCQELLVMSLAITLEVFALYSSSFVACDDIFRVIEQSQKIIELTKVDSEDELEKECDKDLLRKDWPMTGKVQFKGVTLRYKPELEPSMNGVSFKVSPRMRVGIIGKQESGKDSIIEALLRIIEHEEGQILIDGINIKDTGLHILRKNIMYIPSQPYLPMETVREHLDPGNETPTSQLQHLLKETHLKEFVNSLNDGLDTKIQKGMLSNGQRQLLYLARAINMKTKILFIEDTHDDQNPHILDQIQNMIRTRFRNRTVFIVSRRLDHIIDAERIMVMNEGRLTEFGHPYKLLVQKDDDRTITNINGNFAQLVISTGIESAQNLFEIAEHSYLFKNEFMDNTKNTLSILDNRTGKSYEIEIKEGMLQATLLQQIKSMSGEPLRSFDPAYMNTVNCISRVSYIDGEKGILEYRGFPIEQLASKSNHIEVIFLVIYGQLPTQDQVINFESRIRAAYPFNPQIKGFVESYKGDLQKAHPMGMLLTLVSCLSSLYPESNPAYSGGKIGYKTQTERDLHIHRIVACVPALAAACLRVFNKQPIVEPDSSLGYVQNFLRMAFGPNDPRVTDRLVINALDTLFILHADHEQNCSTAAIRHMTSSLADVYVSLAGAVTALYGPRHGGANQAVLMMLEEIGDVKNVPSFLNEVKEKKRMLMGFGHRIYKNFDPRAKIVKSIADSLFQVMKRDKLLDVAIELERVALSDSYFITRKLYPNVDFYSGVIYKAIGFPMEYMPVLFAVPRVAGWLAHWNEFIQDPDNKIVRPKQLYLGERARDFIEMRKRKFGLKDAPIAQYDQSTIDSQGKQIKEELIAQVGDQWRLNNVFSSMRMKWNETESNYTKSKASPMTDTEQVPIGTIKEEFSMQDTLLSDQSIDHPRQTTFAKRPFNVITEVSPDKEHTVKKNEGIPNKETSPLLVKSSLKF